ncbi:MAG: ABC transporter ATP-binding protein [Actinobacteria bacterium]|nr:ABC transporter ATP-binding protein [Actinomycetota bacterium]
MKPLLEVRDLDIAYSGSRGRMPFRRERADAVVRGVSFTVGANETVALVGESGSGKTTIARAIAGLLVPSRGQILFQDRDIGARVEQRSKELHREIQLVFQNPDSSLNPRRRIRSILDRPLRFFFRLSRRARRERIGELLQDVHLDPRYMHRFPRQLSGGERQRVAIAGALAAEPKLILCDEIVSALDVSVQANILDLLRELQAKRGISYLFIAHDLAVVRWLAQRVLVLYRGHVMEEGTSDEVFSRPFHPYTEMLLKSVPEPDVSRPLLAVAETDGRTDGVGWTGKGCPFSSLCPRHLGSICDEETPPRRRVSPTHALLCHIPPAELAAAQASLDSLGDGAASHRASGS